MNKEKEIIYTGDNSIIYHEKKGDKSYARKILRSEFPTPDQILNFNNELEFTQDLKVEGVRKVISKERIQNKHSLLLEYIDGVTLKEAFIDNRRTLSEILEMFIKITNSLIEIHRQGIIHITFFGLRMKRNRLLLILVFQLN